MLQAVQGNSPAADWKDGSSQDTDVAVTRVPCYPKYGVHEVYMLMHRLLLQAQRTAAYLEPT